MDLKNSISKLPILIVLLQLFLILLWASRQGSLYWDVYYTMENTHYLSESTPGSHYINRDQDFEEGRWYDTDWVVDTLRVDYEESLFADDPEYIIKSILRTPYFSILNMTESLLSPGRFSRWPSVLVNAVFFTLTQLLLWKLVYRLEHNEMIAMLTILMYGSSGMAFSMATYARFYMFTTLLIVLYTYIHVRMWEFGDKDWLKALGLEIITFVLAYWSIENAQLSLFFFVIFISVYNATLLINRRFRMFAIYAIPVGLGGGLYLVYGSNYWFLITHVSEAFNEHLTTGPTLWVLDSILTLSPFSFIERLAHMYLLIGRFAFGCWPVLLMFCIGTLYLVIRERGIVFLRSHIEWVICISTLAFILVAGGLRFYVETRYSSGVFPFIAWMTALVLVELHRRYDGIWMRVGTAVILLSIIAFTVSGIRIDSVYSEDKPLIDRLHEPDIRDVVIMQQDQYNIDAEIIYAVSVNVHKAARFMAIKADDMRNVMNDLPDEFLLASRVENEMIDELSDIGYTVIWTGSTYCDHYYYLSRGANAIPEG